MEIFQSRVMILKSNKNEEFLRDINQLHTSDVGKITAFQIIPYVQNK